MIDLVRHGSIWHGHTEHYCMVLHEATFQTHLKAYRVVLPMVPAEEAMRRVTRCSYWAYAHLDPAIRCVRLPDCLLSHQQEEQRYGA